MSYVLSPLNCIGFLFNHEDDFSSSITESFPLHELEKCNINGAVN